MAAQGINRAERKSLSSIVAQSLITFLIGSIVLGGVLFLLAGTVNYWQAWIFIIIFMGGTVSQGIYLAIRDPELLERRKKVAPKTESLGERSFIIIGLISNFGVIILCALDHRFGWSHVPTLVSLLGDGLLIISFVIYYFVFEENSFASSSIQTYEGQKVITSGLYSIIRHPKYVGDLFLGTGVPLALGSWWGLFILVIMIPALAVRIIDEEKLLLTNLSGYDEYMKKVKYRLFPNIW